MIKKCMCVIFVVFLLTTSSCLGSISENVLPQELSTEDLKIIQVKKYDKLNCNKVMKATLNVLQNNYYFIEKADSQIGFIAASREFDTRDKYINIKNEFGYSDKFSGVKRFLPFEPSYAKTEADINVTSDCDKSTVRISFRKRVLTYTTLQ